MIQDGWRNERHAGSVCVQRVELLVSDRIQMKERDKNATTMPECRIDS